MKVAITGATGFLGRYIVGHLVSHDNTCRCWYRPQSDRTGFEQWGPHIEWVQGELGNADTAAQLVAGCDAVVHAALYHPGGGFRGGEGNVLDFVQENIIGFLQLIEAARRLASNFKCNA